MSPLPFLLLRMMPYGMEFSFGQFRPAVRFLPTASLLTCWRRGAWRGSHDVVQTLFSNSQNTGVLSATNPKHSTIHRAMKTINSTPVRPSNVCKHLLKMGKINITAYNYIKVVSWCSLPNQKKTQVEPSRE